MGFIGRPNTSPLRASTGRLYGPVDGGQLFAKASRGCAVKKVIDLSRRFGVDSRNLREIGHGSALDRLQRAEMPQQGAFARRADTRDLLQTGFADVALAPLAMRTHGEAMRLVAQRLHKI